MTTCGIFKTEIKKLKIVFGFYIKPISKIKTKPSKFHCSTHRIVKDNGMSFTGTPTHTLNILLLKSSNLSATDHLHHELSSSTFMYVVWGWSVANPKDLDKLEDFSLRVTLHSK